MSTIEYTWTVRVETDPTRRHFHCVVYQDGAERCATSVGTSTAERAAKMALENHLDEDCCGCFDDEDDDDADEDDDEEGM